MIAVFVQKRGHTFYKHIDEVYPKYSFHRSLPPSAMWVDESAVPAMPTLQTDEYHLVCRRPPVYVEDPR